MRSESDGPPDASAASRDEGIEPGTASNDHGAFALLYRRFRHPIYRYLRARTPTDDDAADLAQQVFLKVFEALPRYEDRGLRISAWLFRIARNTMIDAARRTHPMLPLDELSDASVYPSLAYFICHLPFGAIVSDNQLELK